MQWVLGMQLMINPAVLYLLSCWINVTVQRMLTTQSVRKHHA